MPRQRVRKTKIYSWWHTPFLYLYRGGKVVCKRVYEVERILLILTPQKWGVIIVQKGKKNILII